MDWLEISIDVPPEFVEPLSNIFQRYGTGGVVIENPSRFNPDEGELPPVPDLVTVRTYIPADNTSRERKSHIEVGVNLINHLHPIGSLKERVLAQEDWETSWQEHFHPLRIGKNIVICPTWREYDDLSTDVLINIDPGMAFGTGHHPTTRMCLELLEKVITGGEIVVDVGCGSGILSIGAIKLGAKYCVGIEIDTKAANVARGNCELNLVVDQVKIETGTLKAPKDSNKRFDLLVANISAKVIVDLAALISSSVRVGGQVILSGILVSSLKQVKSQLGSCGIRFVNETRDGDWVAILAIRDR